MPAHPDSAATDRPESVPNHGATLPPGVAHRTVPPWLLEGAFIVVSVLLGFAVAQFGEYRSNRELVARVLTGIEAEMIQNLAVLEPFVPMHREWLKGTATIDQAAAGPPAFNAFFSVRPAPPAGAQSSFPSLRRSA